MKLTKLNKKQANPLQLSAKLQTINPLSILDFCSSFIMDILRLQLGGTIHHLVNVDYEKELNELTHQTSTTKNMKFVDYLQQVRKQLNAGMNLNKQLLIENVLIRWREYSCF